MKTFAKFAALMTILILAALGAVPRAACAVPISVSNPGFESNNLPTENATAFNQSNYSGWIPSSPAFVDNNFASTGPFNVPPGDITIETPAGDATIGNANGDEDENPDNTFPKMALHVGNDARVNQTTSHVINTAQDGSFVLIVDVGRDSTPASTFQGYDISLYGQLAGVKTIIKTLQASVDGGDPAANSWVTKTLTLTAADFAAFNGQSIGISLYRDNQGSRPPLYDNVSLQVLPVPEPSSLLLAAIGGALVSRRRRQTRNPNV